MVNTIEEVKGPCGNLNRSQVYRFPAEVEVDSLGLKWLQGVLQPMAALDKLQENYSEAAKAACLADVLSQCQGRGVLPAVCFCSQAIHGNRGTLCFSNSVGNGFAVMYGG